MNIFVTDTNPHEAAKSLDDRRLVKMVLETAQIICNVYRFGDRELLKLYNDEGDIPYKATHANHPVCIWARSSRENFLWLVDYFIKLNIEYSHRFYKSHKSFSVIGNFAYFNKDYHTDYLIHDYITFQNCAANASKGLNFKHMPDTVEAYRAYLSARWLLELKSGYQPKFTKRDWPTWYNGTKDIGI